MKSCQLISQVFVYFFIVLFSTVDATDCVCVVQNVRLRIVDDAVAEIPPDATSVIVASLLLHQMSAKVRNILADRTATRCDCRVVRGSISSTQTKPNPYPTQPPYNDDAVMRQSANFHKAELLLLNVKLHTYSAVKSNQVEYFVKSTSNWPKSYSITK